MTSNEVILRVQARGEGRLHGPPGKSDGLHLGLTGREGSGKGRGEVKADVLNRQMNGMDSN